MRSSISNFKERLRLPRLFFRKPSREEQIHGGPPLEFERPIPPAPWRGIAVVVTIIVIAVTTAWELYCRSLGYGPTLNDNEVTRAPGSMWTWMNSKKDWANDRSNLRWRARPLCLLSQIWRMTKIFTAQLFVVLSRFCFSRRPVLRRWTVPKKE
jgi:hypothetical protein